MAGLAGMLLLCPVQASVVLSEVLYDSSGSDNGNVFVELFGAPGTVLDGLLLEGINGTDGTVYRSITLSGMIPTDGVFVVGDDSGDGTTLVANTDLVAEIDLQNGPDSVVLRNLTGVLDALGYGDFTGAVFAGEGNAAVDAEAGNSLARFNPLQDTDNNLADFVTLSTPTPGAVPVATVPLPPALLLFLSGVLGLLSVSRKRT
ncbi:MAG: hypothetical protein JSU75_03165 [Gammaproteobacteria bacterium]|nr:MAG: hypothetical protein JSU75_03165 [Gammaproteobacteria bacterium]